MANGLFISDFRGAGTTGAPGVGSTRRGLETARQAEQITQTQQIGLQGTSDQARIDSIVRGAILLKQQATPENKERFLVGRIQQLDANGIDSSDSREALQILQSGDLAGLEELTDQAISLGQGQVKPQAVPAGIQEFEFLSKNLTGADLDKARRIELGLDSAAPKIFQSSAKTFDIGGVPHILDAEGKVRKIIVDGNDITTEVVAASKAEIAGAKTTATEEAKLTEQLKFSPKIKTAVKLAEKEAAERGEVLTDLARMEASLPGIKEVVNELLELSALATSTFAGRIFDVALKESGFGSTKGANARAKLISIVDNQVLPLLRETFGAAFTVQEGENLKASLVDPNASPSQKREQLEAFLAQKERNIRAKQAQLDAGVAQDETPPAAQKIGRFTVEVIDNANI